MVEKKPFDMLNMLRCVAILIVFLLHGRSKVPGIGNVHALVGIVTTLPAWSGVWILLFLSGFLLGMNFFSGKYSILRENGKINWREVGRFYKTRFLRIAPLYYGYVLLVEILRGGHEILDNPLLLLRIITFTYNGQNGPGVIGHLWYVSLAMQSYLLAPLVFLAVRRIRTLKARTGSFFLVLALGLGIRFLFLRLGLSWYTFIYTFLFANLDLLVCGMLLAGLCRELRSETRGTGLRWKVLSVLLFGMLILYNCYLYYIKTVIYLTIYRILLPSVYMLLLAFLLLVWLPRDGQTRPERRIWGVVDLFSRKSYAFYILHVSVLGYIRSVMTDHGLFSGNAYWDYLVFFGASFVLTCLLSALITYGAGKPGSGRKAVKAA